MAAGESAFEVARRQREKAERLARSADLWEKGARGEVEVARVLGDLPASWFTLHDLAWPGRQRANIDHVVVGPGGVFVIDAKNWSGRVEIRDQVLRQNGYKREETIISVAEAALAFQPLLPARAICVAVLCFVRDEPISGWARDVMVCSTANLRSMLESRPHTLDPEHVQRCLRAMENIEKAPTHGASHAPRLLISPVGVPSRKRSTTVSKPVKRRWGAFIAGVALLLAATTTGGLTQAANWFSHQLVGIAQSNSVPQPQPQPTPTPSERRPKQQDKKSETRSRLNP